MSNLIKQTLSSLYKSKISSEEAVSVLEANMTSEQLAEYIVDAFNQGWISPFNVGLDSEGDIV